MKEFVILVDEQDNEIGTMEKMEAHLKGALHRAFSIFIFNDNKEMLIHQRAFSKYHSGGLWSNACCSHPRPGESLEEATQRRLVEEMGFDCELEEKFAFRYRAELDKDLIENEYDHVFFGTYNKDPQPDSEEVADFKWVAMDILLKDIKENREKYSYWFIVAMEKIEELGLHK